MEEKREVGIMYVDYEGLLVSLSHVQYFDIDILLGHLLEKARERFDVQRAIVLGNWKHHASRDQLEQQGFLCRSISATGTEIGQMLLTSITESLATGNAADAYILVSGESTYNAVLRVLRQANRKSVLWTLVTPSSNDQALCSEWEPITAPNTLEVHAWPRQVMLQAIVLVADHLQSDTTKPFLLSHLCDHLAQFRSFHDRADTWLAIAIREQILLQQQPDDTSDVSYGYLNRQHPVVQKALLSRERILMTLSAMLHKREWVAFSALEKGLRTAKSLTASQHLRHAWLELLVAEGVLIAGQVPQLDGAFQVTTLRFNLQHPIVATLQRKQLQNLVRLIVAVSNLTIRKNYPWMAIASLLKVLTAATTRIEARATLSAAEQQGILEIGTIPSRRKPTSSVATVKLQPSHELVQDTLNRRDQLIALTHSTLTSRNTGVSESILTEAFITGNHMEKEEALFWIRLLISEGILYVNQITLGSGDVIDLIYLEDQDSLVDQVLSRTSTNTREVK